jgi:hypothetical protein
LLLLVVAVAGAVALARKRASTQANSSLWREATKNGTKDAAQPLADPARSVPGT